jgi:hypothetical protein
MQRSETPESSSHLILTPGQRFGLGLIIDISQKKKLKGRRGEAMAQE